MFLLNRITENGKILYIETEIENPSAIYLLEEKKTKAEGVFVLSAFPEFLVEYYGENYGARV